MGKEMMGNQMHNPKAPPDTTICIDDTAGNIGTIDVNTGAATLIGNTGLGALLDDIAFSPTGQLFGETGTELYSINQTTGAATPIGAFGVGGMNGLTFDSNGTLYGSGDSALYTINPANGLATLVGLSGLNGWASAGDLTFLQGTMYETVTNGAVSDLARIDPNTGAGTLIGQVVADPTLFGLVTGADGSLYGLDGKDIYSIDPLTGAGTLVQSYAANPSLQAAAGATTHLLDPPHCTALHGVG